MGEDKFPLIIHYVICYDIDGLEQQNEVYISALLHLLQSFESFPQLSEISGNFVTHRGLICILKHVSFKLT